MTPYRTQYKQHVHIRRARTPLAVRAQLFSSSSCSLRLDAVLAFRALHFAQGATAKSLLHLRRLRHALRHDLQMLHSQYSLIPRTAIAPASSLQARYTKRFHHTLLAATGFVSGRVRHTRQPQNSQRQAETKVRNRRRSREGDQPGRSYERPKKRTVHSRFEPQPPLVHSHAE